MKRAIASLGLALSMAVCGNAGAQAQSDDYPSRTITFLCPFPAGGGTDILTRMLAQELQDKLKRPVIVENRPGAGTQLAAGAAAKSAPDGYTLLLAPITTLAIGPSVFKTLPYDTVKDFAPVGLVGSAQFALVANASLGVDKLAGPDRAHQEQERADELRDLGRIDAAPSVHGNVPARRSARPPSTCLIAAAAPR